MKQVFYLQKDTFENAVCMILVILIDAFVLVMMKKSENACILTLKLSSQLRNLDVNCDIKHFGW